MADKKNRLSKFGDAVTVGQWAWDRASPYVIPAIGGTLMYNLSAATDYLASWGPFGWGAIGIGTAILIFGAAALLRRVQASSAFKRAQAAVIEKTIDTAVTNPLKPRFIGERISLYDLRSPAGGANRRPTIQ